MVLRPAEAERPLAVARRASVDLLGDAGAADESDRLHARMVAQRLDHHAIALHDVEDALGQAALGQQLRKAKRGERHPLARLQHEGVPADERLRKHPHRHHQREVEGRHARDHAERRVGDLAGDAATHLELVARRKVRKRAPELDALDRLLDLGSCLGKDLAVLVAHEPRELVEVRDHPFAQPVHHLGPLADRPLRPRRERRGRGGDRAIDVVGTPEVDLRHRAAMPRIDHLVRFVSRLRLAPPPGDPVPRVVPGREGRARRGKAAHGSGNARGGGAHGTNSSRATGVGAKCVLRTAWLRA